MNLLRWTSLVTIVVVMTLVGCGGGASSGDGNTTADAATETATVAVFCGKCGAEKGNESCCAADGAVCESCGLHKGTKLCCAALADEAKGKDICSGCGQVAEATHTCAVDGVKWRLLTTRSADSQEGTHYLLDGFRTYPQAMPK